MAICDNEIPNYVYDLNGRLVRNMNLKKGVYLVRTPNKLFKVIVP